MSSSAQPTNRETGASCGCHCHRDAERASRAVRVPANSPRPEPARNLAAIQTSRGGRSAAAIPGVDGAARWWRLLKGHLEQDRVPPAQLVVAVIADQPRIVAQRQNLVARDLLHPVEDLRV